MTKTIEIIVSPSGETRLQTNGFAGSSCQDASRVLEEALGARQSETLTAEFHQHQDQQNRVQEGGCS